eukprot:Nk52_evm2s310 gene=Nk52_evmTU2s310
MAKSGKNPAESAESLSSFSGKDGNFREEDLVKEDQEEKKKGGCCGWMNFLWGGIILVAVGIIIIVLGIVIGYVVPEVANTTIKDGLVLSDGSDYFKTWANYSQPTSAPKYNNLYLWDLQNLAGVTSGAGAPPSFLQRGPYVYREIWVNIDCVWTSDGFLTYTAYIWQEFQQDMSGLLTEQDLVYNFNPVLLGALLTVGGDVNLWISVVPTTTTGLLDIVNNALQVDMPTLPIINIFDGMWQPLGVMLREFHKLYNPQYIKLANDAKNQANLEKACGNLRMRPNWFNSTTYLPCLQAIYDHSDDNFKQADINAYCLPGGKFEKPFYHMYQVSGVTYACDTFLHTKLPGIFESFDWADEDLMSGMSNWLFGLGNPGNHGPYRELFEAKGEYAPISKTGWKKWAVTNTTQYASVLKEKVGLTDQQYDGVKSGSLNVVSYAGAHLFVPTLKSLLTNATSKLPADVKLQDIIIHQMANFALTGGTDILALGGGALAILLPLLVKTFPQSQFTSLEFCSFAQKFLTNERIMNIWVTDTLLENNRYYDFEPTKMIFDITTDNCKWLGKKLFPECPGEGFTDKAGRFKKYYEAKDYNGARSALDDICKQLWDPAVGGDCKKFFTEFGPLTLVPSGNGNSSANSTEGGNSNNSSSSSLDTIGKPLALGTSEITKGLKVLKVNELQANVTLSSDKGNDIPQDLLFANWNICSIMGYFTKHLQEFASQQFDATNMGAINRRSVHDIVFGYKDPLLAQLTPDNAFVPGIMKNWPSAKAARDDPLNYRRTVNSGQLNVDKVMEWVKWNNTSIQPQKIWPGADDYQRMIRGHDAQQFTPGKLKYDDYSPAQDMYWIFLTDVFRPVPVYYKGNFKHKGITMGRFEPPMDLLAPDAYNNSYYNVTRNGILPLTDAMNAPIAISQPWFLYGRGDLKKNVTFIQTQPAVEDLQTIVGIEPWTGVSMYAHQRLQANQHFMPEFCQQRPYSQYGGKDAIIPLFWIDVFQEITDKDADTFKSTVYTYSTFAYFCFIGGPIIGSLCCIAGFVLIFLYWRRGHKQRRARMKKGSFDSHTEEYHFEENSKSSVHTEEDSLYSTPVHTHKLHPGHRIHKKSETETYV